MADEHLHGPPAERPLALPPAPPPDEPGIDYPAYLRLLRRNAWLIGALALGTTLVVSMAMVRKPDVYTAGATLLVEPDYPRLLDIRSVRSEQVHDETRYIRTQYQLLKSRALAEQVIRDEGLRHEPLLGGEPAGPHTDWSTVSPTVVADYEGRLGIDPIPGTRLIAVTFSSSDPDLSARIANAHAEAYVEQGHRLRAATNEEGLEFLRGQLGELQDRLETSETALNGYRWEKGIIALDDRENVVVEQLDDLITDLSKAEEQRLALEADVRTMEKQGVDALPEVVKSGVLGELNVHLAIAESEHAKMATQFKPTYPRVAELRRKADAIRKRIRVETKRVADSVENAFRTARDKEDRLRARLDEQKTKALELKDESIRYAILEREVDTNRRLYDSVLERMKEMTVAAELRASNVSVVDWAVPPDSPSGPERGRAILLAAVVGCVLGLVVAFLREAFDDSVKTADEAEHFARVPSLGSVPELRGPEQGQGDMPSRRILHRIQRPPRPEPAQALVITRRPSSAITEAYRTIRTSLLLSRPGGPPRTMLVTSALDGEGKTTTSVNIAAAFAQIGASVLVIDADLRRPTVHRLLDVPATPGLTEVLTGQCSLDRVLRKVPGAELVLLPAGECPPNPTELLGSDEMRRLIAAVSHRFDFVLIDSPAALAVADAIVLSTLVEGVVLVVRAQRTPRRFVRKVHARLAYARAPLLGTVLNGADDATERYTAYYTTVDVSPEPPPPGPTPGREAA